MTRQTWKHKDIYVSWGRPSITPFRHEELKDMKGAMYFYYDINILRDNKTIFEASTHDFPKVQNLGNYIDHVLNFDMEKAFVTDDYQHDGFSRKIKYTFIELEDSFGFDMEYSIKIDRFDYHIQQRDEKQPRYWKEFVLTFSKMNKFYDNKSDANNDSYIDAIIIKHLTEENMVSLKETANRFCEVAIKDFNDRELPILLKYDEEYEE